VNQTIEEKAEKEVGLCLCVCVCLLLRKTLPDVSCRYSMESSLKTELGFRRDTSGFRIEGNLSNGAAVVN
jgi:hypothetical protein